MRKLLKALVRSDSESLFARAMSAGFWAGALRIILRVAIIVRTVILARLLSPDDFGLMAIAVLSITLLEKFTQSGVEAALVQQTEDIKPYLNSAWTLNILRGLLISATLVLAAPWIAEFFRAPEATPIIRALSISVLIAGFVNIGTVNFIKDLRFDRLFLYQVSGKGLDVVVSIGAALALRNVWALVIGALAGAIGKLIASYVIDPYRPRLRWVGSQVRQLFRFGKWITASQILAYIALNADDIVVGRILGVRELGLYRMAYNFSQSVATEITSVTTQVAFPTYSKMQGQILRLRTAYLGTVHLISFIGFPLAIGTIIVAEPFVLGVLGPKWADIVIPLQLLSIAGLLRGLAATVGPLLSSQGRPDIPPRFTIAKLVVWAVILVPLINAYGIDGAALTVVIGGFVSGVPALVYSMRTVEAPMSSIWQTIGIPAVNSLAMALVVVGATMVLPVLEQPTALAFLLSATIGVLAYIAAVLVATRLGYQSPKDLVRQVKKAAG